MRVAPLRIIGNVVDPDQRGACGQRPARKNKERRYLARRCMHTLNGTSSVCRWRRCQCYVAPRLKPDGGSHGRHTPEAFIAILFPMESGSRAVCASWRELAQGLRGRRAPRNFASFPPRPGRRRGLVLLAGFRGASPGRKPRGRRALRRRRNRGRSHCRRCHDGQRRDGRHNESRRRNGTNARQRQQRPPPSRAPGATPPARSRRRRAAARFTAFVPASASSP